jgi:hypothetical protein
MSGFVVDSRTLVAVRDTLGRLHDQLVGMHTVVWHGHGTLGGHMLEAELEHFCGTWHYSVAQLGGQLQDLTRRLGEASAAYERIEERITHAGGGSGATTAGSSGHSAPRHSAPANSASAKHHSAPAKHHSAARHTPAHHGGATAPGGPRYSGGAGLAPATGGGASHSGHHDHSGAKHKHPGVGSGTTVIPPARSGGSHHAGTGHHPSSGSGQSVIGGTGPASGSSGSGTTTVDEKIHHAEARQRAELAAVLKVGEK